MERIQTGIMHRRILPLIHTERLGTISQQPRAGIIDQYTAPIEYNRIYFFHPK